MIWLKLKAFLTNTYLVCVEDFLGTIHYMLAKEHPFDEGHLYIANTLYNRIIVLNPDGTTSKNGSFRRWRYV